jgi:molybdenum storage protein
MVALNKPARSFIVLSVWYTTDDENDIRTGSNHPTVWKVSLLLIPPHRTNAGTFLLAECYGCASHTLIKDVDGLYDADPKVNPNRVHQRDQRVRAEGAQLADASVRPAHDRPPANARQLKQFQIINGLRPELLDRALRGEHVGTIVRKG